MIAVAATLLASAADRSFLRFRGAGELDPQSREGDFQQAAGLHNPPTFSKESNMPSEEMSADEEETGQGFLVVYGRSEKDEGKEVHACLMNEDGTVDLPAGIATIAEHREVDGRITFAALLPALPAGKYRIGLAGERYIEVEVKQGSNEFSWP